MLISTDYILIGILGLLLGVYIGMRFSVKKTISQSNPSSYRKFRPRRSEEASKALQEKLIQMVGGDRQEAERLVARARFCQSNKSEAYYWWRAIQALEQKQQQQFKKLSD